MILKRGFQASPDQTQAKAYVTEEIGTIGCEASPVLYGSAVKQTYKGYVSAAYVKPSDNLVEANVTYESRGS